MSVFTIAVLPLLVALGFWQLDRAEFKHRLEDAYFEQMASAPVELSASTAIKDFTRVRLVGRYDQQRYFLVDNQVHEGRPGYWLIGALETADGTRWLVNAGWIAAPPSRAELPLVDLPNGNQDVEGTIWPETGLMPLLADDPWQDGWPKRVQRMDIRPMATSLGVARPVEVRLDFAPAGLAEAASQGHDFRASRHQGYAAQWFGLALVLGVGYIIYGFKRNA